MSGEGHFSPSLFLLQKSTLEAGVGHESEEGKIVLELFGGPCKELQLGLNFDSLR